MDPNEHNSGESEEEEVAPQVKCILIDLLYIFVSTRTGNELQDSIEDIKSTQSQLADEIDKVDVNADEVVEDENEEEEVEDENEIENDEENEAEEGESSPQNADVTQVKAPQG